MVDCKDWAEPLANDVILSTPQAVQALPADQPGELFCTGCFKIIPDNSADGLLGSCPNCWCPVTK